MERGNWLEGMMILGLFTGITLRFISCMSSSRDGEILSSSQFCSRWGRVGTGDPGSDTGKSRSSCAPVIS